MQGETTTFHYIFVTSFLNALLNVLFFRTPLDQLRNELNKLDSQINKIQNQMKAPNTHPDVREQMSEFLPVSFFKYKNLVQNKAIVL